MRLTSALVLLAALVPGILRAQADVLCGDPGDREVRALRFVGNTAFSSDELSARVITTPSSITRRALQKIGIPRGGARRCYPDVGLRTDVASLKQFYQNSGFYETQVDTLVTPAGNGAVDVTFRIQEGAPLLVDSLTVTGLDSSQSAAARVKDLQLKVGGRFGRVALYADADSIRAHLRDAGYAHAEVFAAYTTHLELHRSEVEFDVRAGPRVVFGTIDVQSVGFTNARPSIDSGVVLSLLGFRSGDVFSDRAINDAQRNLYNLGAYRHVSVTLDTMWRHGDSLGDVLVDLREDAMHQFDQEEGWAELDCFRTSTQYTDRNFNDKALRFEATARLSKLGYGHPTESAATRRLCNQHYMNADSIGSSKVNDYFGMTITQPTLFGTHWVPSYSAYTERRSAYKAYLRSTDFGFGASFRRDIMRNTPLRLGFTLEEGKTNADAAVLCGIFSRCDVASQADVQRRLPLGIASAALQQTTVDNVVSPTTGYNAAAEFRLSAPYTVSDPSLAFRKITADFSWYHQLANRVTFRARARTGFIRGGQQTTGAKLPPPQERLYAGGASTIRGFRENEVGPQVYLLDSTAFNETVLTDSTFYLVARPGARQVRSVPGGGNTLVVLNAELRIRDPFFPDVIEYAPFVDAGQVWIAEVGKPNLNLNSLLVTPGVGVRYFSPVGAIQMNMGYNRYSPKAGTAYFSAPVDIVSNRAPQLCVTSPGDAPLIITRRANGELVQDVASCPATFAPPRPNTFFSRLTFTFSIGTDF
jgi:outer membrane protein insertion porin family